MTVIERFDGFDKPGYFSRYNSKMISELFLGLDENGHKAIELRAKFTPRTIHGTESIEVTQYKRPDYNTIRFSLCNDEVSVPFCFFCEDIANQLSSINDQSAAYLSVINRFYQWKQMFMSKKKNVLSDAEIMGLIGEILFLKDNLAKKIGLSEALKSWSGQELTHKDFSHQNDWYEIKAISSGKTTVRISSLQQLDSTTAGELVVFALEKMSSTYQGLTLNKLVLETHSLFDTVAEKDLFMAKVALQGYEYNTYYDDIVFEEVSCRHYKVTDNFPRLVRANVPKAITALSYDISLNDITDFLIQ